MNLSSAFFFLTKKVKNFSLDIHEDRGSSIHSGVSIGYWKRVYGLTFNIIGLYPRWNSREKEASFLLILAWPCLLLAYKYYTAIRHTLETRRKKKDLSNVYINQLLDQTHDCTKLIIHFDYNYFGIDSIFIWRKTIEIEI